MDQKNLLSMLRTRRSPEVDTLDEYFAQAPDEAWERLFDVACSHTKALDDEALEWAIARMAASPGTVFAVLINLAAKEEDRRKPLLDRYLALLPFHPERGLGVAGYQMHQHNRLLEEPWLDAALAHYERNPEGAWGVFESAAMYRPRLIRPDHVEAFEARRAGMPVDYFTSMLSLAGHRPEQAAGLLERVLRAFPEHPAAAIEGACSAARSEEELLIPGLVEAMIRHFDAAPAKAWEFFEGACRVKFSIFDDALLTFLGGHAASGEGRVFSILELLIKAQPDRAPSLLDRYVGLVRLHPEHGIKAARNDFTREDSRLIRPDLVKAVCEGFAAAAYPGYEFLRLLSDRRPELIGPPEVEAALRNIPHATNYAFGFFNHLLARRPEFTRECTLALFEALAQEPVNRAHVRVEELESIIAISEAAHIKTGLENALREPPRVGSRRARALMAIMFRQKLRARRHVLLEALRYAATAVLWRKVPTAPGEKEDSEKFTPPWDFLMFIIDNAGDDAVSTAAAERFLEGAFQLHYLYLNMAEHQEFLRKLDIGYPPAQTFPPGTEFLKSDADLAQLYSLVVELGKRFETEPRVAPLEQFSGRLAAAESELAAIGEQLGLADDGRRKKLEERRRSLTRQIACWGDPEYLRAFGDFAAECRLPEEARALLRREKKDLVKNLRDALRAEAIRIAVAAVDRSRMELYRNRLKEALGRDVNLSEVEPKILPAFLWFGAIRSFRNNTKYLRMLIEDRIAKRPHDWLRTEPPVLSWAEQVKKARPSIQLDRWRAPFSRDFQYRPKDALAEKKRRIKADLAQARVLLERAGAKGIGSESYEELEAKLAELKNPPRPPAAKEGQEKTPPVPAADPALLQEISMNLERVRISEKTPDSDFEGMIRLTVETDPFEILFMGEYGFASCLSLRGSNAWSAVSNAIDIDKAIVWAKEPGGNVVGRRLLALTPEGVLVFRTYVNRHGLALDRVFDEFVEALAAHCGTVITHSGHAGPLLSDRWYDDGSM